MLISSYAGSLRRIRWDYEDESPLRDARGFEPVTGRELSDEDHLVKRAAPFGDIVRDLTPFFVSRQIFTGAGKLGLEAQWDERGKHVFQLTQRADFFETEVGLETTLKRPIINTRDEPHADPERYRRLHVIVGDANRCEVALFLKLGTTSIVPK